VAVQRIVCLNCGGSSFTRNQRNYLVCDYCGSVFRTKDNVCSNCNAINPANSLYCNECGERLKRRCTVCQHENPGNAEYCANCNAALDVLEFITRRYREEGTQHREELVRSREEDAAFVAEQSARLQETERQRLSALAERRAEYKRRERILFLLAVGGGIVILLVIGVVLALSLLPGG